MFVDVQFPVDFLVIGIPEKKRLLISTKYFSHALLLEAINEDIIILSPYFTSQTNYFDFPSSGFLFPSTKSLFELPFFFFFILISRRNF